MDDLLLNGKLWVTSGTGLSVPSGGSTYFAVVVGDRPVEFRSRTINTAGDDVIVTFYEDSEFSGGVEVDAYNRDRTKRGEVPRQFKVFSGVTPTVTGTPIITFGLRSSNATPANSVVSGQDNGIVYRANTTYLIELRDDDTSGATFDFNSTVMELEV